MTSTIDEFIKRSGRMHILKICENDLERVRDCLVLQCKTDNPQALSRHIKKFKKDIEKQVKPRYKNILLKIVRKLESQGE